MGQHPTIRGSALDPAVKGAGLPFHSFASPLRYPGGKGRLSTFVKSIIRTNQLLDGHYVEVYAGGAGLAWPLLFGEYVQHVHINDVDRSIHAFWTCVFDHTDALCKAVSDTSISIPEWQRQKWVQRSAQDFSTLELGFSTFFLNRANRSGIISGGVIGGKDQCGNWQIDARFNKRDLIHRIQQIAKYRSRVSVYGRDARDFIANVLPTLPDNALVFLDPPYFVKGQELYQNHYTRDEHLAISMLVKKTIKQPWILSYDAVPEILQMYSGYQQIRYDLNYSAQNRYTGKEVMFFSAKIKIPHFSKVVGAAVPPNGRQVS